MIKKPPLWETWTARLPMRPLCCDEFDDGLVRRSRPIALTHRYVQFNNDLFLNWLIFDIDRPDSFEYWETARLPPPNLYVRESLDGHGHVFYALATPVGTCGSHRLKPIEYAAAVQRGMTRRLGADPAYANRLAKNPLHPEWRASWIVKKPPLWETWTAQSSDATTLLR